MFHMHGVCVLSQWATLSDAFLAKGHHVLVDMAYQGFASGIFIKESCFLYRCIRVWFTFCCLCCL